jgi:Zn-dependent metalloprotease
MIKWTLLWVIALLLGGCSASMNGDQSGSADAGEQAEVDKAYDHLAQQLVAQPGDEVRKRFTLHKQQADSLGMQHLYFSQHVANIEVLDAELIVHFRQNEIYRQDGEIVDVSRAADSTPQIGQPEAFAVVAERYPGLTREQLHQAALFWLPQQDRSLRLVYLLEMRAGLSRNFYLVDAHSGEFIKVLSGMPSTLQ